MRKITILISILCISICLSSCTPLLLLNFINEDETVTESSITEQRQTETNEEVNNLISEMEEYKNICVELIYNDLDESWIGKNVTKELLFSASDNYEYKCGATEDFIEEYHEYQHTYRIYKLFDERIDNSFPIQSDDVIRIYGKIIDIGHNFSNGQEYPIIEFYYIDYIRKWRQSIDETKTIEEIIKEREEGKRKEDELNEYYSSLNSDYTGVSKNIDNMNDLLFSEYKMCCDKMNYFDLRNNDNLTGRHVAIHVQVYKKKIFTSEEGKEKRVGTWIETKYVQDDVVEILLYNERVDKYIADFGQLYFLNIEDIYPAELAKEQNLIIYGQIIKQPEHDFEDWEILVRFYEVK